MKFLIDSMLPPATVALLKAAGHDAISPSELGAHNLPDEYLSENASSTGMVIVTENAVHFVSVTTCSVVLIRKDWWPPAVLAPRLATAIDGWARANPEPEPWAGWLDAEFS